MPHRRLRLRRMPLRPPVPHPVDRMPDRHRMVDLPKHRPLVLRFPVPPPLRHRVPPHLCQVRPFPVQRRRQRQPRRDLSRTDRPVLLLLRPEVNRPARRARRPRLRAANRIAQRVLLPRPVRLLLPGRPQEARAPCDSPLTELAGAAGSLSPSFAVRLFIAKRAGHACNPAKPPASLRCIFAGERRFHV